MEALEALAALAATLARMAAAWALSAAVAYAVGFAMYRDRRVESVALPILDILQSIPILGFFPAAVYLFVALIPAVGAEVAAVFLVFTSMAWNMVFGVYQSLKALPREHLQMARAYLDERLTIAHVLLPATLRGLYYNSAVSWANGFFFITASEVISLGSSEIHLFGIGSYVVEAYNAGDTARAYVGIAVGAAGNLSIYLLVWRRLLRRIPQPPNRLAESLAPLVRPASYAVAAAAAALLTAALLSAPPPPPPAEVAASLASAALPLAISAARVAAVLALSAAVGLAVAEAVARDPRREDAVVLSLAFLSSLPAPFLYPIFSSVAHGEALALLLLLAGSLIYAVYNAVAAWRDIPRDLTAAYGVSGLPYLVHVLLPATLPYLATGLLTAWGGAWNATVVAEPLAGVPGIGSALTQAAARGDGAAMTAQLLAMTAVVVAINRLAWKRLYGLASTWTS